MATKTETTPTILHVLRTARADLKAFVTAQAPRYAAILAPTVIIAGDIDETVSTKIHARTIAAVLPRARLIVLPGVGHMVQFAATKPIVEAIADLADQSKRNR